MPLTKLQFKPGVNKETTSYTNEGGWFDVDKVRFRFGMPEKIGGKSFLLSRILEQHEPCTLGWLWTMFVSLVLAQVLNIISTKTAAASLILHLFVLLLVQEM